MKEIERIADVKFVDSKHVEYQGKNIARSVCGGRTYYCIKNDKLYYHRFSILGRIAHAIFGYKKDFVGYRRLMNTLVERRMIPTKIEQLLQTRQRNAFNEPAENEIITYLQQNASGDVNVTFRKFSEDKSPLHFAIEKGYGKLVTYLLEQGREVRVDQRALSKAIVYKAGLSLIKQLVKQGALVNPDSSWRYATPLADAVEMGQWDVVSWLLEQGARFDPTEGFTRQIGVSLKEMPLPILKKLFPMVLNKSEQNEILLGAVELEDFEKMTFLIEEGCDLNKPNTSRRTPSYAFWHSKNPMKLMQYFLDHGWDINLKDEEGYTTLMDASIGGRKEVVEWLLAHGAKKELQDQEGHSAADHAKAKGHEAVYALLKS